MKKSIIYLACPYAHKSAEVRKERYKKVTAKTLELMRRGKIVFSPIAYIHPLAMLGNLPKGWDFWEGYNTAFLQCCKILYVLKLPGWEESIGVTAEIETARKLEMPILYVGR